MLSLSLFRRPVQRPRRAKPCRHALLPRLEALEDPALVPSLFHK
jgi:hypothetical protein